MKRNQKILVTAMLSAASALAMNVAMGASIKDTPHNLGSGNTLTKTPSGNTPPNHSTNTGEICVFCHTPHGGDNTAAVPIWNKKLGINGVSNDLSYKRYKDLGTTTFDASEAKIGSVTIACLSCHDGTQAIDNMINQPGSGGYNPAAARLGGMTGGDLDATTGKLLTTVVQNLGTDLSNDHPVSMQFGGGGVSTTKLTGPTTDSDFAVPLNKDAPTGSGLGKLWWIDNAFGGGTVGTRDRWDVTLYTRDPAADGVGGGLQPFVECGSCHDPHNADNPTFLRIANYSGDKAVAQPSDGRIFTGAKGGPSGLCLTCHTK